MPYPEVLGHQIDISLGVAPLDFQTARTGKRVSLRHCEGILVLVVKGAGTDNEDQTFTLNEHTAASGGTSQTLAAISRYYEKEETTLDGDEQWTKVTQTAAATLAPGDPSAQVEALYAWHVRADQLSAGYAYISVDNDGAGSNAQLATIVYILYGLKHPSAPENLDAPLS